MTVRKKLQRMTRFRNTPPALIAHRTSLSSLQSSLSTGPVKDNIPTSSHHSTTSTLIEAIITTYWTGYFVTDLLVDMSKRFPSTFCRLVDTRIRTAIQSVRIFGFRPNSRHDSTYGISLADPLQNMRDIINRSYGSQTYPNISWISWTIMIMLACTVSEPTSFLGSMTSMSRTLLSKRGWLNTLGQTSVVQ